MPPPPSRTAIIGSPSNFWLHTRASGFDLTHPPTPTSPPIHPRLTLQTTTSPITLDPAKSALVIIDMQNFFLSPAFGRAQGPGHAACAQLARHAIPAARRAGVRLLWLNWGLSEAELADMPPGVKRAFAFKAAAGDAGEAQRENARDASIDRGLGSECGWRTDAATRAPVDAGRLLMRGSWNAALYPPLDALYAQGAALPRRPDVWLHKNRMSGMWGAGTACAQFLEHEGVRTLLFAGVNTDQCVAGTLTDSFSQGFDCVLLRDACGTTSPAFAQQAVEFNVAKSWGFVCGCEDFARGVEGMEGEGRGGA